MALWLAMFLVTIASVVPHWTRFAYFVVPTIPGAIESVIGPDVRGTVWFCSYELYIKDGAITIIDAVDPDSDIHHRLDYDYWDDIHYGQVRSLLEERGLWWASHVTEGWRASDVGSNPTTPEMNQAVEDWVQTIPRIGDMPQRSTRWTLWVVADAACSLLLVVCMISTWRAVPAFIRRTRYRRVGACTNCGYDLAGLVEAVCPECGASSDDQAA